MKKVLTFGTFDILHPGHEYFLKKAKEYGDSLYVVVARDMTVKQVKGMFPQENEEKRLNRVRKLAYVDRTLLGSKETDRIKVIEEIKPDVICLGYDQTHFTDNLKEELATRKMDVEILRIDAYKKEEYKSSKLRKYY